MHPEQRFCPKSTFLGNRSHNRSQLNFSFHFKLIRLSEKSELICQKCRKNVQQLRPKLVRMSEKSNKSNFICHDLKVVLMELISDNVIKWSRIARPGYRKTRESTIAGKKKEELLTGSDRIRNRKTTVGKFCARNHTSAGEEMLEWAERNNLYVVDTHFQKPNRGTWKVVRTRFLLARRKREM